MPKIDAPENIFYSLLGRKMSDDELVSIFPVAKAELDGHDTEHHVIKIELNDTNRPDLWSPAGVARALKCYETGVIPEYDFFSSKDEEKDFEGRMVIDDESVIGIRDYSIGFAAKGRIVDDDLLVNLIQSQEKLCTNFGRKRKTIAMGIYRKELIKFPVHYAAVDPDKTKFVPLGMTEELSLREICEKHPKGRDYGYIVSSFSKFPYLFDDRQIFFTRVFSVHKRQNSVVAALRWQVNIFFNLLFVCNHVNHFVSQVFWMRRHKRKFEIAFQSANIFQKFCKRHRLFQIFSIRIYVLTKKRDFFIFFFR